MGENTRQNCTRQNKKKNPGRQQPCWGSSFCTNLTQPTGALDSNSSRMLLTMLTELNEQLAATILMVTHDAFSASYCHRILFIKDGQVFNELHRGTDTRKDFFAKILEVVSVLGGEQNDLI